MPRAINLWCCASRASAVGSTVLLIALLLPYTAWAKEHVSPFVTFLSKIGIDAAGSVMNLVVLTAALSSLNAGLYSTGWIPRSMAINGSGPRFTAHQCRRPRAVADPALTAGGRPVGPMPSNRGASFEIVAHIAATGVIAPGRRSWLSASRLHRMANAGQLQRPKSGLPPFGGYLTLAFLVMC